MSHVKMKFLLKHLHGLKSIFKNVLYLLTSHRNYSNFLYNSKQFFENKILIK